MEYIVYVIEVVQNNCHLSMFCILQHFVLTLQHIHTLHTEYYMKKVQHKQFSVIIADCSYNISNALMFSSKSYRLIHWAFL